LCARATQSAPAIVHDARAMRVNGLTSRRVALSALRKIRFFFVVL